MSDPVSEAARWWGPNLEAFASEKRLAGLIQDKAAGLSMKQIAVQGGVTTAAISNWLTRSGKTWDSLGKEEAT